MLFWQSNYFFFSLHATFHFLPQVHLQPNFSAPLTVAGSQVKRMVKNICRWQRGPSAPSRIPAPGEETGCDLPRKTSSRTKYIQAGADPIWSHTDRCFDFTSASNWTVTFGNFQKTPPWSLVCACTNTNSKPRQTKTFSVSPKGILNTYLKAYNVLNIPTQVSKLDVLQTKHSNLKLRRPIEY